MDSNSIRFLIGAIAGVLLLVLGIVRDDVVPEAIGGLLIVLCGARMAMLAKKPNG